MKDFFGTVVEVGDAVVVAQGDCYSSSHLELKTVEEILTYEHDGVSFPYVRVNDDADDFHPDQIISMKSVIARRSS